MIEVIVDDKSLEVRGHAGYAPVGQDIVCSAASMLLYALAAGLEGLDGVEGLQAVEENGYACVKADRLPPQGEGMLRMAQTGYRLLADTYPQCVAFDSKR